MSIHYRRRVTGGKQWVDYGLCVIEVPAWMHSTTVPNTVLVHEVEDTLWRPITPAFIESWNTECMQHFQFLHIKSMFFWLDTWNTPLSEVLSFLWRKKQQKYVSYFLRPPDRPHREREISLFLLSTLLMKQPPTDSTVDVYLKTSFSSPTHFSMDSAYLKKPFKYKLFSLSAFKDFCMFTRFDFLTTAITSFLWTTQPSRADRFLENTSY